MASVGCITHSITPRGSRGGCLHRLLSIALGVPTGLGASQARYLPAIQCLRLVSDDPPPDAEASHPSGRLSEIPCKLLLTGVSISCGLLRPAASGTRGAGLGPGRSKKTWLGRWSDQGPVTLGLHLSLRSAGAVSQLVHLCSLTMRYVQGLIGCP